MQTGTRESIEPTGIGKPQENTSAGQQVKVRVQQETDRLALLGRRHPHWRLYRALSRSSNSKAGLLGPFQHGAMMPSAADFGWRVCVKRGWLNWRHESGSWLVLQPTQGLNGPVGNPGSDSQS